MSGRKPPASSCTRKDPSARKPSGQATSVEDFAAGDEQAHGPWTVLSLSDRADPVVTLPRAIEPDEAKLDYAQTLRLLDSWYRRRVNVAIQPEGSAWYPMYFSGQLPKRQDIGLEWLGDDLPNNSEGYHFHFTDDSLPTGFQLVRGDFCDARLDPQGVLAISLAGAELTITPAKNFP